jgi:hypothetical protein
MELENMAVYSDVEKTQQMMCLSFLWSSYIACPLITESRGTFYWLIFLINTVGLPDLQPE